MDHAIAAMQQYLCTREMFIYLGNPVCRDFFLLPFIYTTLRARDATLRLSISLHRFANSSPNLRPML